MSHAITTRMIEANGLSFETDVCGEGEKFALLLHGFPESKFSWRFQLPLLAEMGYTAWAPNLRGYGQSSRPEGVEPYSITHLAEDVAGLIDAKGAKETLLIAHDWGAVIAWWFAIKAIRPLSDLVIMNVPHPHCFRREFRSLSQLGKSWYVFFFQIPGLPEWATRRNNAEAIKRAFRDMAVDKSRFPPEVTQVYADNALLPGAMTAMMNYYRAAFRTKPAVMVPEPGIVNTRTLMIWGEEDKALGKATTYGTERYVPNLTLRYLPGVSHWVQQEAPETVNAMLKAFLLNQTVPEAAALR